jgi:hypothetical protein
MTFFSKVEETFTIPERGCVIVPAIPILILIFVCISQSKEHRAVSRCSCRRA